MEIKSIVINIYIFCRCIVYKKYQSLYMNILRIYIILYHPKY